jgi:hypothetical protein
MPHGVRVVVRKDLADGTHVGHMLLASNSSRD